MEFWTLEKDLVFSRPASANPGVSKSSGEGSRMVALEPSRLTLARISAAIASGELQVTDALLSGLASDRRVGARGLGRRLARAKNAARAERRRLQSLLAKERELWRTGTARVAGVDEAGMGPLAGPVVAAAVIFEPGTEIGGMDDSKRLSSARRDELAEIIARDAVAVGVGEASVAEIDRINIYHAGLLAMKRAVAALHPAPEVALVDGRRIPDLEIPQHACVGGDRRHFCIAGASIVAKTHRDRLMAKLHQVYPEYGFASHKGYGTQQHRRALEKYGRTLVHRRSFCRGTG